MNTEQIRKYLSNNCYTKPYFLGVFACDQLPKRVHKRFPIVIVANTDPISKPGKHWIGIFISKCGNGEYFDSFGVYPLSHYFTRFLNSNCGNNWTFNKRRLQSSVSSVCGQYTIAYLTHRCCNLSVYNFYSKFRISDYTYNDNLIFKTYKDVCFLKKCKNVSVPQQTCTSLI